MAKIHPCAKNDAGSAWEEMRPQSAKIPGRIESYCDFAGSAAVMAATEASIMFAVDGRVWQY
jgi:hypothetical protein